MNANNTAGTALLQNGGTLRAAGLSPIKGAESTFKDGTATLEAYAPANIDANSNLKQDGMQTVGEVPMMSSSNQNKAAKGEQLLNIEL